MGDSKTQMSDVQQVELPPVSEPRKNSGYRRLQVRHRALIVERDALKPELVERDEREAELQTSIDRLLEQHKRLMQTVRAPQPWFENAHQVLGQLENNPDRLGLQTMTAALAQLQSRLSALVMRTTI
jgi:hypothetical protein